MGYWDKKPDPFVETETTKPAQTIDVSTVGQITAAQVQPMEAWERQPEETGPAWTAFQVFRDLGPGRTIPLTRQAMMTDEQVKSSGATLNGENGKLKKWAYKYNWEVRALAYDKMIDKKRIEEHVEAAKEMTRRHLKLARMVQERGAKRLEEMAEKEIAKLKPIDAAKLIGQGVDMERLAMGQPTSQSKSVHSGKVDHGEGRAVKEVRSFKQEMMEKLDDIERKRTGTQQIIDNHQTPEQETEANNGSTHTIRSGVLPSRITLVKDQRVS